MCTTQAREAPSHRSISPLRRVAAALTRWGWRVVRRFRASRPCYIAAVPPPPHVVGRGGLQVVVITNDTIPGDNAAAWVPAADQFFDVASPEQAAALLEARYRPGSIDVLILGGHGERAGAGVRAREPRSGREVYIDKDMPDDVAARLRRLLAHDAEVYIAACGGGRDPVTMAALARKLGAAVTATPGSVYLDYSADAPWLRVAPPCE